jgi:hypothetical protein
MAKFTVEIAPDATVRIPSGRPRNAVLDDQSVLAELIRIPAGVAYVDMTDTVCDDSNCEVIRDGLLIYRDRHHLSATYSRHIGSVLADRIEAALAKVSDRQPENGGEKVGQSSGGMIPLRAAQ